MNRLTRGVRTASRPIRRAYGKRKRRAQERKRVRDLRDSPRLTSPPSSRPDVLGCSIAYNEFGGYCVPLASQHRVAAQTVLKGEVYERDTIEVVAAACLGGDIVHAGTYFGDFLPALSRALAPEAMLWAFEPNLENYRCAEVTARINGLSNVRLAYGALSDRPGTVQIAVTDAAGRPLGGMSRVIGQSSSAYTGVQEVAALAIDRVIPSDRTVSVIQLDVEGHETEALAGAIETITRCTPVIIVESLPESDWLEEFLVPLGYRLGRAVGHNAVLQCEHPD